MLRLASDGKVTDGILVAGAVDVLWMLGSSGGMLWMDPEARSTGLSCTLHALQEATRVGEASESTGEADATDCVDWQAEA